MNKKDVLNTLHIKTTCPISGWRNFKLTDLTDFLVVVILFTYYRPQSSHVLWIYRPMHRTDLFIVNGADLEYNRKTPFKISW